MTAADYVQDEKSVGRLQHLKTGALIAYSVEAGAILGRVPPEGRIKLRSFAQDVGLAFQIADDLLDAEGHADQVGKAVGKDANAGKATFLSLLGPDRARAQARMLVDQALGRLKSYGAEADLLRAIAAYAISRSH
jgi:farnesyl diphosphate synthase